MVRINRRIITPMYGEKFAVYGIEKKDNFGYWREAHNFTKKEEYERWAQTGNVEEILEKVGNWEIYPEL